MTSDQTFMIVGASLAGIDERRLSDPDVRLMELLVGDKARLGEAAP